MFLPFNPDRILFENSDEIKDIFRPARSRKALSSEWIKEKIRLISKVCENTIMGIDNLTTLAPRRSDPEDRSPGAVPVPVVRVVFDG